MSGRPVGQISQVVAPAGGGPAASEGRRIARNSLLLGAGESVALGFGFVTTILVTDHLGDRYGLWIGAQRFVGLFLGIAQFGLHPLLIRAVAARRDRPGALLGTVLALRGILSIGFLAAVALGTWGSGYLPAERWLLAACVVLELVGLAVESHLAVCEGLERMGRAATVALVRAPLVLGAVALAVSRDAGLPGIVAAYALGRLLELAAVVTLTRNAIPGLRLSVERARMAPLLREAVPFVAIGLAFTALRSLEVVILTRVSSVTEASLYGAARNFFDVLLMLPVFVQRALLPAFSRLAAGARGSDVASDSLEFFSAVTLPAAVGLALLADPVVALYPSGEFAAAAGTLRWLAAALPFACLSTVSAAFLTGADRLPALGRAYGVALPVQLAANLLLVPRHGAAGAAIATVAAHAALAAASLVAARSCGARLPATSVLRHALAAAGMGAALLVLRELWLPVSVAAGLALYTALLLLLAPERSLERRILREALARWRRA